MRKLIGLLVVVALCAVGAFAVSAPVEKPQQESIRSALESGLTLTVAAEGANVIAVTVAGSASMAYEFYLLDAAGLRSLVGAFTCAETGDGTLVTTTAKPSGIFTTSAAGAAVISVTDVATGSSATVYLVVRPLDAVQPAQYAIVTFDGV